MMRTSFGEDVELLRRFTEITVLSDGEGGEVAMATAWQGKTMTSSLSGTDGDSLGWINRPFLESRRVDPQANLHGGEDRLWIGPEGGQFSFYFDPGQDFAFSNWRCPELIDRAVFEVVTIESRKVSVAATGRLINYAGTEFYLRLEREVSILDRQEIQKALGFELQPGFAAVGHESRNTIRNLGNQPWRPATGMVCLWILGMFPPTDSTEILLPFVPGNVETCGPILTSDYFGTLDSARLKIDPAKGLIRFRGDGKYRSKLGVSHQRSRDVLASHDPLNGQITLVQFNRPDAAPFGYVNNLWRIQEQPYQGDAVNVYNDGVNESGSCLGPFYELETLSPALALESGESFCHQHRTIHVSIRESSSFRSSQFLDQHFSQSGIRKPKAGSTPLEAT